MSKFSLDIHGFRFQTAFVFGALSVALAVVLAVASGSLLSEQNRREAGSALQVVAQNAAHMLADGLFVRERETQVMAGSASLWKDGLDTPAVKDAVARMQATQPFSAWIGVMDAQGIVKTASGGIIEGKSVAHRTWFQEALKGVHVGDLHQAQMLAALLPPSATGEPLRFVDFAAPIMDGDKVIGVFGVHGSWDWARAVVESLMPEKSAELKLEVFIFSRDGALIYAPPGSLTPEQAAQQRLPTPNKRPLSMEQRSGNMVVKWSDGIDYLTSIAPVEARSNASNLGWTVVAREPTSVAFAAARLSLQVSLLLGAAAAIGAVGLAWMLAGLLSNPLVAMARAARNVEAGMPGATIPIYGSNRELFGLSMAFAGMTERLIAAKEVLEERVRERTAELEKANVELEKLARHDPLTGLLNRRAFDERMQLAIAASRRSGSPLSVLMIDADHFKSINDRFGHDTGDEVLKAMSRVLTDRLRETDAVARMGGEEFAVLLPNTDERGAELVAQGIVARMSETAVPPVGRFTVSAGAATASHPLATSQNLLVAADRALYVAKGAGRNCVRSSIVVLPADAAEPLVA